MNTLRFARRFALVGVLIEIFFLSFWALDWKFNFFHLPTFEEAAKLSGNYSQPALRTWLVDMNFVLCPPLIITLFGMDAGWTLNIILASIAAALNGALYFLVGLVADGIWNKMKARRIRSPR